ncbi:MAG: ribonuclease P protein component [Bdellovibrionales bacterium]|nr:ribonuclease P protein component [Bdellovibrionales bacterium]
MVSDSQKRLKSLRSRSDFLEISRTGSQIKPCGWLILAHRQNTLREIRCGWTIPRYVGGAVVRNRLRRWCREYFRTHSSLRRKSLDINIIFRRREKGFYKNVEREELYSCLDRAVGKLARKTK